MPSPMVEHSARTIESGVNPLHTTSESVSPPLNLSITVATFSSSNNPWPDDRHGVLEGRITNLQGSLGHDPRRRAAWVDSELEPLNRLGKVDDEDMGSWP